MTIKQFYERFCTHKFPEENTSEQSSFINLQLKEFYNVYLEERFNDDFLKLQINETVDYYQKVLAKALKFINYYSLMKPFQKKINLFSFWHLKLTTNTKKENIFF